MDHCYQAICRISFSSALHAEFFDQLFEFFNIEKKKYPKHFSLIASGFSEKKSYFPCRKENMVLFVVVCRMSGCSFSLALVFFFLHPVQI